MKKDPRPSGARPLLWAVLINLCIVGSAYGAIDYSIWEVQEPDGSGTTPDVITSAQLLAGYSDTYFYTATDGGQILMDPATGITTAGSTHPRCEARELTTAGANAAWAPTGINTLSVTGQVIQLGDGSGGKTTIGQVYNSTLSIPLCELIYSASLGGFEILYEEAKGAGTYINLNVPVSLGAQYSYVLSLSNGVLTVTINGTVEYTYSPSAAVLSDSYYFKFGNYDQTAVAGAVSTVPYTVVEVYDAAVVHDDSTPTPSPTAAAATSTFSATPSNAVSSTATISATPTSTSTGSPSGTATFAQTATLTAAVTFSPSATFAVSKTGTPAVSPSATATATLSGTPTPVLSPSDTATGTPTGTGTLSASPSGTPTSSFTATPDFSPSVTGTSAPSLSPSPSPTPTASMTVSASATPSGTVTATPSDTAVAPLPTSTATATTTASPTATSSPQNTATSRSTPSPTGSSTAQASPGATGTATPGLGSETPALSATPNGTLVIDHAQPVPNPNPKCLMIHLQAPAEGVSLEIWSRAFVLVARCGSGPWPSGWSALPLPADSANLPLGVYYYRVWAQDGSRVSAGVTGALVKL